MLYVHFYIQPISIIWLLLKARELITHNPHFKFSFVIPYKLHILDYRRMSYQLITSQVINKLTTTHSIADLTLDARIGVSRKTPAFYLQLSVYDD